MPLADELLKRTDCNIVPFYYHPVIQINQERHAKKYEDWPNQWARTIAFEHMADGVTYLQPKVYKKVHDRLSKLIDSLDPKVPLVIIAPSLGGKVIMDHIWDSQQVEPSYRSGVPNSMGNLKLLITNGCNLPFFINGLADDEIEHIKQDFKWLNFYDLHDALGHTLVEWGYEAKDIPVKTKFLRFIPAWLFSHVKYWQNKKFLYYTAKAINKLK